MIQSWRYAAFLGAVVFLVFFRANSGFTVYSSGDDACYVQTVYDWVGHRATICPDNFYAKGTAVFWLPAAVLAKLGDRFLPHVWGWSFETMLPVWIGLTSFLLWVFSVFLVIDMARVARVRSRPALFAAFAALSIPVLYYVTARTTMAHAAEVFLGCLSIWWMYQNRFFPALLAAAFSVWVRYNNLPLLVVVGAGAWVGSNRRERQRLSILAASIATASVVLLWGRAFGQGYAGFTLGSILSKVTPNAVVHTIFGMDWGLVWMNTGWIVTLFGGLWCFTSLSWPARASLAWMLFVFLLSAGWHSQGDDFGYRYLLGSYAGTVLVCFELAKRFAKTELWRVLEKVCLVGLVWLLFLTWIYKTDPRLSVELIPQHGWGNPSFQFEALKTLWHPFDIVKPILISPIPTLVLSFAPSLHPSSAKIGLSYGPAIVLALAALVAVTVAVFTGRKLLVREFTRLL